MRKLIVCGFIWLSLISCNEESPVLSECMESKIEEILDGEVWNPPARVYSYQYAGESVFYITSRCCDFFGEVYDSKCQYMCAPDGGITGNGDGKCSDFFEKASSGKLIWEDPRGSCQTSVIIDEEGYESAPEEYGLLEKARVDDDCLFIQFGASGCSGSSWIWSVIDAGLILESSPEQRNIKFSLSNQEQCAAHFMKEVSFDLTPLRISGSNKILLNLENYNEQLVYEY